MTPAHELPGHDGEAIATGARRDRLPARRLDRFSMHVYNSSDDVGHALATLDGGAAMTPPP